jgi:hypothetical protein
MTRKQHSDEKLIARAGTGISEDEIPDHFKTRARMMGRLVWRLVLGFASVASAIAIASISGHGALVTSMWGQTVIAAVTGVLFVYAIAMMRNHYIQPARTDSPRLVHIRMENYHRRWRGAILINIFMMLLGVVGLSATLRFLGAAPQMLMLSAGFTAVYAFIVLMCAFILSVGPGGQSMAPGAQELLNDEFDRGLRARTIRFGYMLMLAQLGAVLLLSLLQPNLTLIALSCALYAGFALPALYYIIADWRASRGCES